MSAISYMPLGGAQGIGSSCYIYRFGDRLVMIDCGVNPMTDALPKFGLLERITDIIVTHGHRDHCGALMHAHILFPKANIYMTEATKDFVRIHIRKPSYRNNGGKTKDPNWMPYEPEDVDLMLSKVRVVKTDGKPFITDHKNRFYAFAYNAGHLLGAVSPTFLFEDRLVFHSGDYTDEEQFFAPGAARVIRGCDRETALVNAESTYLNTCHHNLKKERASLARDSRKFLKKERGAVLVATLGYRAPEIWMHLYHSRRPKPFPMENVYVDGSAEQYFRLFRNHYPNSVIRFAQFIGGESSSGKEREAMRERLLRSREPFIVIASGAALQEESAAGRWARKMAEKENKLIALTSYVDPCSDAAVMFSQHENPDEKLYELHGLHLEKGCAMKKFNYTAHTDQRGIEDMEKRLMPKIMAFSHGDETQVRPYLEKRNDGKFVYPQVGEEILA